MKLLSGLLLSTAVLLAANFVQAGVVVGGTRLVFDGTKKEASLSVNNVDKVAYLIQSWVEPPEGSKEKTPFIITPPLFRLDGEQQNILRVVRAGGSLPEDKESLFWLNVKAIPSAQKKDNTLQLAIKTRIKLIYRPAGVKSDLQTAAQDLKWQQRGNTLVVNNPTAHYITLHSLKIGGVNVPDVSMVAPGASATFKTASATKGSTLNWQIINDFGGLSQVYSGVSQ